MGINNHQPSQDVQGVEDLFDFEQNATPDSNIRNGTEGTAQAGENAAPQPPAYLHSYPNTYTTASTIDSNQPDIVMENQSNPGNAAATATTAAIPAQAGKLLRTKQLVLLRSAANGQTLPVYIEPGATLTDLIQLLHSARIPSAMWL